jgi:bifunctional non-homologous end joining protein LigD
MPAWIEPQLAALVKAAPEGDAWLHEIKLDGYRMHARLDAGAVRILTRRGNDWTDKYPAIAGAITFLPTRGSTQNRIFPAPHISNALDGT